MLYREAHVLLAELAEAVVDGTRKEYMETLTSVPPLIIDDFGMQAATHRGRGPAGDCDAPL